MVNKNLYEHPLNSTKVYTGKLLHVHRDEVRLPDGKTDTGIDRGDIAPVLRLVACFFQ